MSNELLGELKSDPAIPGSFEGSVKIGTTTVPIKIDLDGVDKDRVFAFASAIASQIDKYVSIAARFAAEKLLDAYNEDWRHYDAADGRGGFEAVTDPELDADAFVDRLKVTAVNICAETECQVWFDDGGMFWGHSVYVSSSDGETFKRLHAGIFG